MRIRVRSRIGNAVLGMLGVVYLCAALALLVYHVMQTWETSGLIDRAVQIALIGCAACGVLFIVTAVQNLGLHLSRHAAPPHREGAAAAR